jgi:endogenous inhibitor of DNA gyrase (YacG/DUF329 family)
MASTRTCPSCGKPAAPRGSGSPFPFCSDRCRLLDLGRWLGEEYRIPAGLPGDGAVSRAPDGDADEDGR